MFIFRKKQKNKKRVKLAKKFLFPNFVNNPDTPTIEIVGFLALFLCEKYQEKIIIIVKKGEINIYVAPNEGKGCDLDKGKVLRTWPTGDEECGAESNEYECGGIYHNNYMDVLGNRNHDCFWDCTH